MDRVYHCQCGRRFLTRNGYRRHWAAEHGILSEPRPLPWSKWVEEAQARNEPAQSMYRPSLTLPQDLIRRVDLVAKHQGMERSELVALMIESYMRSWEPIPR